MEIMSSWQSSQTETIILDSEPESPIPWTSIFESLTLNDEPSRSPASSQSTTISKIDCIKSVSQPEENLECAVSAKGHSSFSQESENFYDSRPIFSSNDSMCSNASVSMLQNCDLANVTQETTTVIGQNDKFSEISKVIPKYQPSYDPLEDLKVCNQRKITRSSSGYVQSQRYSPYCQYERKQNREFRLLDKIKWELGKIDRKTKHEVGQILLAHYKLILEQILTALKRIDNTQDIEIPKTVGESKELAKRRKKLSDLFKQHEKLHFRLAMHASRAKNEMPLKPAIKQKQKWKIPLPSVADCQRLQCQCVESEKNSCASTPNEIIPPSNRSSVSKVNTYSKRKKKRKSASNPLPEVHLPPPSCNEIEERTVLPVANGLPSTSHSSLLKHNTNMLLDFSKLKLRLIEEAELLPMELNDSWSVWEGDDRTIGLMDVDCW